MSDIRQFMPMPSNLVLLEKFYVTFDGCLCYRGQKDPDFSHCEYNIREDALLGLCFCDDGTSDVEPLVWYFDTAAFDIANEGEYQIVTRDWLGKHSIEEAFGDKPAVASRESDQGF